MTTIPKRKYNLTEPPAELSAPLTVELLESAVGALNAYRQARHAYLSHQDYSDPENDRLRDLSDEAARELGQWVATLVKQELGEPPESVLVES